MKPDIDVVIVGGGAAGIGAARRLAASGLTTVLIEASSRLGGRAWTQEVSGLPLDMGCGWLHSASRNSWTRIAEDGGFKIDRRVAAWSKQYRDLGFPRAEQAEAHRAFDAWIDRMTETPPASDCAADALEPGGPWNAYLQALSGFISGARLEQMSAIDYLAYDHASTNENWRLPAGYGSLIAGSFPAKVGLRLATPARSIELEPAGVAIATPAGTIRARSVILTVSTAVLVADAIRLPSGLEPWRKAAERLPLGRDEKLFLEILDERLFEPETQVLGDPHDPRTGAYYLRPLGRPVVECFVGGEGARVAEEEGPVAGFTYAIEQIVRLFGSDARGKLKPLIASSWCRLSHIGGAYSYAVPGEAGARQTLARPFEDRLFFAGEATNARDFSTAHGAHDSGVRAADEAIAVLEPARAGT
jgi:monoamine oxidase